jgi:hypothetical protein
MIEKVLLILLAGTVGFAVGMICIKLAVPKKTSRPMDNEGNPLV